MIRAFIEVLVDLWNFVFAKNYNSVFLLPSGKQGGQTNLAPELVKPKLLPNSALDYGANIAYVVEDKSPCFSSPLLIDNTKVSTFDYGDLVLVEMFTDSYAKIRSNQLSGFMALKDLVDDIKLVVPNLKSSFTYKSKNPETIKLRKYINQQQVNIGLHLPLQPIEFIYYKLRLNGIAIDWPKNASKYLGEWNHELKGIKGVSMSVEPRTRSLMEFNRENDNGGRPFAAWIESVSPDLTITMQSIGRVDVGEYRSEVFTYDEWKEWRPVFISFS